MRKSPRQPLRILFRGILFTRVQKRRVINAAHGITSGPFYSRPNVDPADWAYTPDSTYLWAEQEPPVGFMQCIQQSVSPKTPHPGFL